MFSANLKPKTNPFSYHRFRNDGTKRLLATTAKCSLKNKQDLIVKIKERMNGKVEISPSAYDMAWVAMVPERVHSGEKPHFPAALDWIVENQNPDGSWGLRSPSLLKDSLYCTLACLLALRKWNVSQQLVQKGVEFISSSASAARNDDEPGPIGFELVFPMMLHYAKELGLSLPLDQDLLDTLLQNRDSSLKRNKNLEYVGEGVGNSVEFFQKLLTWQRSNGSLFNSPATTAAALIRFHDDKCLQYLTSLLTEFKAWVPTIHPVDVYAHLCLVDCLQDLGVGRFFQPEIHAILHETFRLWEKKDEEICGDVKCHAMAFRLLRLDGYPVSSDELDEYIDEENFFNKVSIESSGVDTVFELYKASQVRLPEDEGTLDSLHHWTFNFLEEKLRSKAIQDRNLERKVEFNLKNYHGILEAIRYRRSIDLYDVDHIRLLKTAYRCPTVYNEDILLLAAQDFMTRQALNQKELQVLTRWYDETRLEKMDYGRHVIPISHFLNANTFPDPEQSEALLAFAKTMTLVTRLDDFFDHHGSREHSVLIIELIKQWDDPSTINFPTEEVEILYSALHSTVTELAETAYPMQGRYITSTITHLWVELLTCFLSEMDSITLEIPPNIEEYMEYAWISISCRLCILVAIHFVGEKISEELVMGPECFELSRHVGSIARLLNDIQTFEKERKERTLNSVIIQLNADKISEEEAVLNVEKMVEYHRKELLKMVVRREGSLVPKRCKDVFWRTGKVGYYLYDFKDEFTSPHKMKEDMKLLFHHPLNTTSLVH